jgi:hypothetical protein
MRGAIPSHPQYIFMVWCLIKQKIHIADVVLSWARGDNFTFTFIFKAKYLPVQGSCEHGMNLQVS